MIYYAALPLRLRYALHPSVRRPSLHGYVPFLPLTRKHSLGLRSVGSPYVIYPDAAMNCIKDLVFPQFPVLCINIFDLFH